MLKHGFFSKKNLIQMFTIVTLLVFVLLRSKKNKKNVNVTFLTVFFVQNKTFFYHDAVLFLKNECFWGILAVFLMLLMRIL